MSDAVAWRGWLLDPAPGSRRQARLGRWYRGWRAFRRNGLAMTGLVVVLLLVLMAAAAPLIVEPDSATLQVLVDRLQPASGTHWFGTDELGRDIFARILFGARTTLIIVGLVSAIVVPVGLGIGLPAGYFGGWIDAVLMRITDIFLSFPRLVLPSSILGYLSLAYVARMTRSFMLGQLKQEYILATLAKGLSPFRVVWVHALGNVWVQLVTVIALTFGSLLEGAVLTETVFAWPGLGLYMKNSLFNADLNAVLGGTMLVGVVYIGLNMLSDLLYPLVDPRAREQR